MKNICNSSFFGLIVLYNPEGDLFIENIQKLIKLGISVIIYDNSTSLTTIERNEKKLKRLPAGITFFHNRGANLGLSSAFFETVEKLIGSESSTSGIFFFDQDSVITEPTILRLMQSFNKMIVKDDFGMVCGIPVKDDNTNYRIRYVNNSTIEDEFIEVSRVPISFALIPLRTFGVVGNFEKDFFIDYIDNNFCFRCRANGLKIFVDREAPFLHEVGLGNISFLNMTFPYSTADRHYYQIRNRILSSKNLQGSKILLIKELIFRIGVIAIIGLKKGDFFERMKYVRRGLWDGKRSVVGKYK